MRDLSERCHRDRQGFTPGGMGHLQVGGLESPAGTSLAARRQGPARVLILRPSLPHQPA